MTVEEFHNRYRKEIRVFKNIGVWKEYVVVNATRLYMDLNQEIPEIEDDMEVDILILEATLKYPVTNGAGIMWFNKSRGRYQMWDGTNVREMIYKNEGKYGKYPTNN